MLSFPLHVPQVSVDGPVELDAVAMPPMPPMPLLDVMPPVPLLDVMPPVPLDIMLLEAMPPIALDELDVVPPSLLEEEVVAPPCPVVFDDSKGFSSMPSAK
jgi:hypothetical protein